ncbi:hypothetical protein [Synechococcus sp. 1G10]|uniref:hypothetical protein n=1 Tax=Synechococcus sp. 1G10 TaxID=2025605 RepID=UPI0013036DAB|nr:hypothetical protein [Synechococcus sp. 1G10]
MAIELSLSIQPTLPQQTSAPNSATAVSVAAELAQKTACCNGSPTDKALHQCRKPL